MRKKKQTEHENHERWLVSYADFITLLFAFFVVMFAISQVDAAKLGRFVESVNVAFEFRGVFPSSSVQPINPGSPDGSFIPTVAPPRPKISTDTIPSRRARDLQRALERAIRLTAIEGRARVRIEDRGVIVSLMEAGFFDAGSAEVRPDALEALRRIATELRDAEGPLAVEGHTDSVPIRTDRFPSNWELSTARATAIVRFLITEVGFEPSRLSATGYAEFRPEAGNETSEGRATNRRVDLVLLVGSAAGPPPR